MFSKRKTIIIVGSCLVDYQGRANSELEIGERILIIKKDGSVLVHRTVGYEPVNWQPSGCIFHTKKKKNNLEIKAIRQKPSEILVISFNNIFFISILELVDKGEFYLYASEEAMQRAFKKVPLSSL